MRLSREKVKMIVVLSVALIGRFGRSSEAALMPEGSEAQRGSELANLIKKTVTTLPLPPVGRIVLLIGSNDVPPNSGVKVIGNDPLVTFVNPDNGVVSFFSLSQLARLNPVGFSKFNLTPDSD